MQGIYSQFGPRRRSWELFARPRIGPVTPQPDTMVFAPSLHETAPRRQLSGLPALLVLAAAATFALSTPAFAAEGKAGSSEALLVGQIVLLIVTGRLLGEVMLRLGQPAVMGQ